MAISKKIAMKKKRIFVSSSAANDGPTLVTKNDGPTLGTMSNEHP